jgi:AraC-like DNA-binding protein
MQKKMLRSIVGIIIKRINIFLIFLFCSPLFASEISISDPDNDFSIPADSIFNLYDNIKNNLPNDIEKAHKIAKIMNEASLKLGIDSLIAQSNFALGLVYYFKDYYKVSSRYYREALKSNYAKDNVNFLLKIENNLGINCDLLKDYNNALKYYKRALISAESTGDSTEIYEVYINIGLAFSNIDSNIVAVEYTKTALKYFEKVEDKMNLALCWQNLANFEYNNNYIDKRKNLYENALKLYFEIQDFYMVSQIYHNISFLYKRIEDYKKSNSYIDSALKLIKNYSAPYIKSKFLLSKGINLRHLRKFSKSEEILKGVLPSFTEFQDETRQKETLVNLMMLYYDWKKTKKHSQYLLKYDSLSYALNKKNLEKAIEENMILSQIDINLEALENQKEKIKEKNHVILLISIFITILLIGILVILFLYKNLSKSYKDLYEKNIKENLVRPLKCKENEIDRDFELFTRITSSFEKEKLFQKQSLTLNDLSAKLNTNEKYISQAINKYSDTNFNGFVNKYRIEVAKKYLLHKELNHYSLEKIAELSGFNNRVTFARVFKSFTKLSPSAFRKMSEKKSNL